MCLRLFFMFLWDGNAIIIETCFDGVFVEVNKGFVVGVKKISGSVCFFLSGQFGDVFSGSCFLCICSIWKL